MRGSPALVVYGNFLHKKLSSSEMLNFDFLTVFFLNFMNLTKKTLSYLRSWFQSKERVVGSFFAYNTTPKFF